MSSSPLRHRVLLGVTGSVAALRTLDLVRTLEGQGYAVRVVATQAALYFFDPLALGALDGRRNPALVSLDEDEWPGRDQGRRWQRDEPVLHIELRRWADLFLLAPLDANTLAKLSCGLCDNCLTCVWRAWDPTRPRVLAPAMNTLMWEQPVTARQLRQLAVDCGLGEPPPGLPLEDLMAWINRAGSALRLVPPQAKRLACGDVGVGGLADLDEIASAVRALLPG